MVAKLAERMLLSGNEAVALAALNAGVRLGTGYPGTPSTEILEAFAALGGKAQWAPNEKVALEVALGAAFGGARALVTMKHVGVNVAADPLFTAAYVGLPGGFVLVMIAATMLESGGSVGAGFVAPLLAGAAGLAAQHAQGLSASG